MNFNQDNKAMSAFQYTNKVNAKAYIYQNKNFKIKLAKKYPFA